MWRRRLSHLLRLAIGGAALTLLLAAEAAALTVTPSTWNIIGLDSNTPSLGPNHFPVGAEVCSTTALSNIPVTFNWDSGGSDDGTYIYLRPGSNASINIDVPAGGCTDAYFEVEVNPVAAAFDQTRRYHITANGTASTPTPREIKVEHLVSQGRNAITGMEYGTSLAAMTSVASGGAMDLLVGNTYYIRMTGYTATQGYEQLESFVNFPNTIFQILAVSTTYSADTSPVVNSPNDKLYADACGWDNDPLSPSYLSCSLDGKAGGTLVVTYEVKILSRGSSGRETLNTLIHDFSGSSFHYNSDFSTSARFANLIDPTALTISKSFAPTPNTVGGVSALTFTLSNPNYAALGSVSVTDLFPAQPAAPGDMTLANTTTANTCGGSITDSGGGALNAGDVGIRLSGATIPATGSCNMTVNVTTSSTGTYTNTSNNVFVGAVDTGKKASASLTVNTDPPAGTGSCGATMATWTFLTGFNVNAPAATVNNIGTATARPGTGTAPVGLTPQSGTSRTADGTAAWGSNGNIDAANGVLTTTQKDYFEFRLNSTGYTKTYVSFYAKRANNGPIGIAVYSSNASDQVNPEPYAAIYNSATALSGGTGWTAFGAFEIPLRGNDTYVRIYAYDSANTTPGADIFIDDVVFTGCRLATPPTIGKTFAASPIAGGGSTTLTLRLTNSDSVPLTGATFTDTFPAGMTVAAPLTTSNSCGGSLVDDSGGALAAGDPGIRLTSGSLAASGFCEVAVNVTAPAGIYNNTSGFPSATESGTNKSSIATATLTALAAPTIAKGFAPAQILAGGISTLTFTLHNPNPADALSGVAFADTFPAGLLVANPLVTGNSCGGSLLDNSGGALGAGDPGISLSGAGLAAGASCTVSVAVTAAVAGSYANTSGAVSHTLNGTWSGNTASATLQVNAPHLAIGLLKQVAASSSGPWSSYLAIDANADVYYRLTVENLSEVALSSVAVTDPAPYLNLAGCAWKDGDGAALTAPFTLPAPDADNGHLAICRLGPVVAQTGSHPNTATVTGSYLGTTVSDNSTATYATSSLELTKSATEAYFGAAGDLIHYSYTVSNIGEAYLAGPVVVTDNKIDSVSCPALSGIGDLDDNLDPGESVVCTATYTVTPSDVIAKQVVNIARARVETANSPTATHTVPLKPELGVTKSNSVGGNAATNTPFAWTLTAGNAANAGVASFSSGQRLLVDDLPSAGASYSVPAVASNAGGTSGTISCAIAANTLTCSANGAVAIPAGGSFSIVVTTTPSATGALANPRSGGLCQIDPDNRLVEFDESNNGCSNAVTVTTPAITLIKSANRPYFSAAGEIIGYSYLVRNSGAVPRLGPVTVADNKTAVVCPAVATVGNLDANLDPGEQLTCTASYTVLAADLSAGFVTNTATATVAGTSSPQVSLTVPIGPNLSVTKSNSVTGATVPFVPFSWTLTASNAATAGYPAIFTAGQVLLRDNLPDVGVSYAAAAPVTVGGGTSGTVSCGVAAATLTCSAVDTVTLPAAGSFAVTVTATPATVGTFTNPKGGGICRIDPNTLLAETSEADNDCNSNAVTVSAPSLTILKLVQPYWDPLNGYVSPAKIPGALVTYSIVVSNSGEGPVDGNTLVVTDKIPTNTALYVGNLGSGSPVAFSDPDNDSGFDPPQPFTLDYFSDTGCSVAIAPTPDADSVDAGIRCLRIHMSGTMRGAEAPRTPEFTLSFRARIQ